MQAYITEATAQQLANEIPLHIYEFPVEDPKKKYEGVSNIRTEWKRKNGYMPIAYNQSTIVSLVPVSNFCGYESMSYEVRTIDPENPFERTLLERIIKESLLYIGQTKLKLKRVGSDLQEWTPIKVGKVLLYPAISFHVNVKNNRIHIGFNLTHKLEYDYNLQQMIENGESIYSRMKVIHSADRNNFSYEVEKIAPYSVFDKCPLLKKSIYEYHSEKNNQKVLASLHEDIKVIHVKTSKGDTLSYAANQLKPLCSFKTLKPKEVQEVKNIIKMKPDERMRKQLRMALNILQNVSYLRFEKNPFFIELNHYQLSELHPPNIFMNKQYSKPLQGLKKGQIYKGGSVTLTIFFDETIETKLGLPKTLVFRLIKVLQKIAQDHGVKIVIRGSTKGQKFDEKFFKTFTWEIRALESIFTDSTVLAIISEEHLNDLPTSIYDVFKRQFGGKWDISSQVLTEKVINSFQAVLKKHQLEDFDYNNDEECKYVANIVKNDYRISYSIFNVLLGIYVKSGMQPWVLAERTYTDCFIGLDVSHEDGKSTAGIMNVIGKNGHLIKQSAISGLLAGEKIDTKTLEDIILDVLFAYKEQFGEQPKHITIHRDGRWIENTEFVEKILNTHGIAFDIVEIIKDCNRRMAFYNKEENKFETKQGYYYKRENEAFLCSTAPNETIGMARPIKIVHKTSTLQFDQIISDIYKLSFMHIHCLNKMRLPATVHYADLSSTAYQRGQISPRSTNVTHLPFV